MYTLERKQTNSILKLFINWIILNLLEIPSYRKTDEYVYKLYQEFKKLKRIKKDFE